MTAVNLVLHFGSQTRPLRAEGIRRILLFKYHCLSSIGRIWGDDSVSNSEVRRKVPGSKGPIFGTGTESE